ncbi:hypothetical protein QLS71_014150 [Mariniflexile litorale]|uniref:Uncharacterized protein n=1 Tax=Mariniflexile litorale TaxID=3045158 RepID=A0AAU7EDF9_9FLAO|nr:hypothetical protein [Mariniflexile sp. KMM 9835]MDQ8212934.1 hypothetical protein [Mariniflexile sp. KMM 9835]
MDLFIIPFFNFNAQTSFRKDSMHRSQWDNNIDDEQHNTKYPTYNNVGSSNYKHNNYLKITI